MQALIIIVIIALVMVYRWAEGYNKKHSSTQRPKPPIKPRPMPDYHKKDKTVPNIEKAAKPVPFKYKSSMKTNTISDKMEDRQNDWLAKQMYEERRLLEKGDLLDLGANHGAECDAGKLKAEHIRQHDDSIDTGEQY